VLGVDPGQRRCGLAALAATGQVLAREVVAAEELSRALADWTQRWAPRWVVIGNGTRSGAARAAAVAVVGESRVALRDEHGTTLAARARWWREHPPRGLWRLVPTSLRVPSAPLDDLVATILAERFLAEPVAARPPTV